MWFFALSTVLCGGALWVAGHQFRRARAHGEVTALRRWLARHSGLGSNSSGLDELAEIASATESIDPASFLEAIEDRVRWVADDCRGQRVLATAAARIALASGGAATLMEAAVIVGRGPEPGALVLALGPAVIGVVVAVACRGFGQMASEAANSRRDLWFQAASRVIPGWTPPKIVHMKSKVTASRWSVQFRGKNSAVCPEAYRTTDAE